MKQECEIGRGRWMSCPSLRLIGDVAVQICDDPSLGRLLQRDIGDEWARMLGCTCHGKKNHDSVARSSTATPPEAMIFHFPRF